MLNAIIRFALQQRLLILCGAIAVSVAGVWQAQRAAIDVFPDLNRPRVTVMTEAPGMAPEEVESLITFPLETALNGATGVQQVRSTSAVGLSIIYVEFEWDSDIHVDRQTVMERLQIVQDQLPPGIRPQLAPLSSIMGQILMLGLWVDRTAPDTGTSEMELRSAADWVVRQRLLSIPGVAQVFTMGGDRRQFHVLVDADALLRSGVTLGEVETALRRSNANTTGGYLDQQGPQELLVRAIGRIQTIEDLQRVVVAVHGGRPIALSQVARVTEAAQVKRGDSAAWLSDTTVRASAAGTPGGENTPRSARFSGGNAVVMTINKQPTADTRAVDAQIMEAIRELRESLPADVRIAPLYAQTTFIDRAIHNVVEALRDGVILVVAVLFLFLLNLRTTFITLTAIPLSLAMTVLIFSALGMSINTMTLGGLAVAIGELVDDAIVDVENIYRRLRENRLLAEPQNPLLVVYRASVEIRSSIVFGTMIVVLVFLPLFALSGMEGRLFAPLGTAYIVSILCSLLVSLTVTPVLSYWLLGTVPTTKSEQDGWVVRVLKRVAERVIRFSLRFPRLNLLLTLLAVGAAGIMVSGLDRDFLPPFNEGAVQLNVLLQPGTSLATSTAVARTVDERLQALPDVLRFVRRTGRAELDEHAEGVHQSEYILELNPESGRSREQQLDDIRRAMDDIPGVVTSVEQPIAHLISHMLSGVKAQVGIKIFGDDQETLRRLAEQTAGLISDVRGVEDLLVEPQVLIPQLRIELDRDRLLQYGLQVQDVNELIQTAMSGDVVSQVLIGQQTIDLVVRLDDRFREDLQVLRRLAIDLPDGGRVPLFGVARIDDSQGPNVIQREDVRRRIVIQCNVTGRGVVDVVEEIQRRMQTLTAELSAGYFIRYEGQFQSQRTASRRIALLFVFSLFAVFLVLYSLFRSVNLSLQVMAALPMAFIGAVAALVMTGQTLTIASMVGFISLGGIAARNGILLLTHYLHLVRHEGEQLTQSMIIRAGKERMVPVLMTALTSGIGLLPLVVSPGQPGREILYPVATVILGGLISSTMLDFLVHPSLFWLFGLKAAARVIDKRDDDPAGFCSDQTNFTQPPTADGG